jgi:hypothetical protein
MQLYLIIVETLVAAQDRDDDIRQRLPPSFSVRISPCLNDFDVPERSFHITLYLGIVAMWINFLSEVHDLVSVDVH